MSRSNRRRSFWKTFTQNFFGFWKRATGKHVSKPLNRKWLGLETLEGRVTPATFTYASGGAGSYTGTLTVVLDTGESLVATGTLTANNLMTFTSNQALNTSAIPSSIISATAANSVTLKLQDTASSYVTTTQINGPATSTGETLEITNFSRNNGNDGLSTGVYVDFSSNQIPVHLTGSSFLNGLNIETDSEIQIDGNVKSTNTGLYFGPKAGVSGKVTVYQNASLETTSDSGSQPIDFNLPVDALQAGQQSLTITPAGIAYPVYFRKTVGGNTLLDSLTVSGAANVLADIKTANNQTYNSAAKLSANLTTTLGGNVTLTGAVTLATNNITVNTDGTTDGNITFGNTVNGAQNLTLAAGSATVALKGNVGSPVNPIGVLQVTAGATSLEGTNIFTNGGSVTFNSPVTLASVSTYSISTDGTSLDGDINFNGTLNGAKTLTLQSGIDADIKFAGSIGQTTPLNDLIFNYNRNVDIQATTKVARLYQLNNGSGAFKVNGAITTTATSTASSKYFYLKSTNVEIYQPIDISAGPTSGTGAGALIYGTTKWGSNILTNGSPVLFQNSVTLVANSSIATSSTPSVFTFNTSVDGAYSLDLNAGQTIILKNAGTTTPLASIAAQAASIRLFGTMSTVGQQAYTGTSWVQASSRLYTQGAKIQITGDLALDNLGNQAVLDTTSNGASGANIVVSGDVNALGGVPGSNVTFVAGTGDIAIGGAFGNPFGAVGTATITSANNVTFSSTFDGTSLTQSAGTGTTTLSGAVTTYGGGAVTVTTTGGITTAAITTAGEIPAANTDGYNGGNIALTSASDVAVGALTSSGSSVVSATQSHTGGSAGTIALVAGTNRRIYLGGNIAAVGGDSYDAANGSGGSVLLQGRVVLNANVTIQAQRGSGGIVGTGASGNITFSNLVDSDANAPRNLGLTSGNGNILFSNLVGDNNPLGNLTINAANNVDVGFFRGAALTQAIAGTGTFTGQDIRTTGAGGLTINSSIVTISGNLQAQSTGGVSVTGITSLAGNVTTSGGSAAFSGAVTLATSARTISTSNGNITFNNGSVNGAQSLTLTAGTGDVLLDSPVGNLTRLTSFTITTADQVDVNYALKAGTITVGSSGTPVGSLDSTNATLSTSQGDLAGGALAIYTTGAIVTTALDASGGARSTTGAGYGGGNVILNAGTTLQIGDLFAQGGNANTSGAGGNAGTVTLDAGTGSAITLYGTASASDINRGIMAFGGSGAGAGAEGAGQTITFNDPVLLVDPGSRSVNIKTSGSTAGDVTFNSTLDGLAALNLYMGLGTTGDLSFYGLVGDTTPVSATYIDGAHDVRVNGWRGGRFYQNAGSGRTVFNFGNFTTGTDQAVGATDSLIGLYAVTKRIIANNRLDTANGGSVTLYGTGEISYSYGVDLNASAPINSTGDVLISSGNGYSIDLGANITTTDKNIRFNGLVNLDGNRTLDTGSSGAGNIVFSGSVRNYDPSFQYNTYDLDLIAGTGNVTFNGTVGYQGLGALRLLTVTSATQVDINADQYVKSIAVGQAAVVNAFDSTGTTIYANNEIGGQVNIKTTGVLTTGTIDTHNAYFSNPGDSDGGPIALETSLANGLFVGSLNTSGNTAGGNAGPIALTATGDITLTGDITTRGYGVSYNSYPLSFTNPILLGNNITLNTTGNSGNITFNNTVNSATANSKRNLTLTAGANNIVFNENVGTGTNLQLGTLTIATATDVTLATGKSLKASSVNQQAGTGTTTLGGPVTTTVGGVSIVASTLALNGAIDTTAALAAGDISLTGTTALASDITTAGGDVTFNSALSLAGGARTITTGSSGDIKFQSTVNGAQGLALTSGAGNIQFYSTVGQSAALGTVTVHAANNVTLTGVFRAAGINQDTAGTGTFTVTGGITTTSGGVAIQSNAVALNGALLTTAATVNGDISITGTTSLTADITTLGGDVAFNSPVTLSGGSRTIDVGASSSGAITFDGSLNGSKNLALVLGSGNLKFNQPVGQSAPLGAVSISGGGIVQLNDDFKAASFNQLTASSNTTLEWNASLITLSGGVTFQSSSTQFVWGDIDTSAAGVAGDIQLNSSGSMWGYGGVAQYWTTSGGDIDINGNLTYGLFTLATGTGNISFNGTVGQGASYEVIDGMAINSAGNVNLTSAFTTRFFTQSAGTGTTTLGALLTATTGGVSITNSSVLVNGAINTAAALAAGDITLTGATSLGANLTTSTGDVSFTGPVNLTGNPSITTGSGTGDITFSGTVNSDTANAKRNLTLTADTGNIQFNQNVGAGTNLLLGDLKITSAHNVTLATGKTLTAYHLEQVAGTGLTKFGGLITTTGPSIVLTGTDFQFTQPVVSTDVQITNSGVLTINPGANFTLSDYFVQAGSGTVSLGADITVAENSSTSGTGITFASPITLTGPSTLASTATSGPGGPIAIGNVDGGYAMHIDTTGATNLNGTIGSVTPLASLVTNIGGTVDFYGASVTTTGYQNYYEPSSLHTNVVLASTSSGQILLDAAITTVGSNSLNINTTGATVLNGPIGTALAPLASIETSVGGTLAVNGGSVYTTGNQILWEPASLGQDTLLSAGSGNITFHGTLDGSADFQQALTVATTGKATFGGDVGGTDPLRIMTLGSTTTDIAGNLTTGAMVATGLVTIIGDNKIVDVDATGSTNPLVFTLNPLSSPTTVRAFTLAGNANINVYGNNFGNTLQGNDGNNVFYPGNGENYINGGGGNNTVDLPLPQADYIASYTTAGYRLTQINSPGTVYDFNDVQYMGFAGGTPVPVPSNDPNFVPLIDVTYDQATNTITVAPQAGNTANFTILVNDNGSVETIGAGAIQNPTILFTTNGGTIPVNYVSRTGNQNSGHLGGGASVLFSGQTSSNTSKIQLLVIDAGIDARTGSAVLSGTFNPTAHTSTLVTINSSNVVLSTLTLITDTEADTGVLVNGPTGSSSTPLSGVRVTGITVTDNTTSQRFGTGVAFGGKVGDATVTLSNLSGLATGVLGMTNAVFAANTNQVSLSNLSGSVNTAVNLSPNGPMAVRGNYWGTDSVTDIQAGLVTSGIISTMVGDEVPGFASLTNGVSGTAASGFRAELMRMLNNYGYAVGDMFTGSGASSTAQGAMYQVGATNPANLGTISTSANTNSVASLYDINDYNIFTGIRRIIQTSGGQNYYANTLIRGPIASTPASSIDQAATFPQLDRYTINSSRTTINTLGQVVSRTFDKIDGVNTVLVWQPNNSVARITPPSTAETSSYAPGMGVTIDNAGTVAGTFFSIERGAYTPFLATVSTNATSTAASFLPTPGAAYDGANMEVTGLLPDGRVVGTIQTTVSGVLGSSNWVYDPVTAQYTIGNRLGNTSATRYTSAMDVNRYGLLVGYSGTNPGQPNTWAGANPAQDYDAWVWNTNTGNTPTDLQTYAPSGTNLQSATGINDKGQILVQYKVVGDYSTNFVVSLSSFDSARNRTLVAVSKSTFTVSEGRGFANGQTLTVGSTAYTVTGVANTSGEYRFYLAGNQTGAFAQGGTFTMPFSSAPLFSMVLTTEASSALEFDYSSYLPLASTSTTAVGYVPNQAQVSTTPEGNYLLSTGNRIQTAVNEFAVNNTQVNIGGGDYSPSTTDVVVNPTFPLPQTIYYNASTTVTGVASFTIGTLASGSGGTSTTGLMGGYDFTVTTASAAPRTATNRVLVMGGGDSTVTGASGVATVAEFYDNTGSTRLGYANASFSYTGAGVTVTSGTGSSQRVVTLANTGTAVFANGSTGGITYVKVANNTEYATVADAVTAANVATLGANDNLVVLFNADNTASSAPDVEVERTMALRGVGLASVYNAPNNLVVYGSTAGTLLTSEGVPYHVGTSTLAKSILVYPSSRNGTQTQPAAQGIPLLQQLLDNFYSTAHTTALELNNPASGIYTFNGANPLNVAFANGSTVYFDGDTNVFVQALNLDARSATVNDAVAQLGANRLFNQVNVLSCQEQLLAGALAVVTQRTTSANGMITLVADNTGAFAEPNYGSQTISFPVKVTVSGSGEAFSTALTLQDSADLTGSNGFLATNTTVKGATATTEAARYLLVTSAALVAANSGSTLPVITFETADYGLGGLTSTFTSNDRQDGLTIQLQAAVTGLQAQVAGNNSGYYDLTLLDVGTGISNPSSFNATGRANGQNHLVGNNGANYLTGGNQDDILAGMGGNNTYSGGAGIDTILSTNSSYGIGNTVVGSPVEVLVNRNATETDRFAVDSTGASNIELLKVYSGSTTSGSPNSVVAFAGADNANFATFSGAQVQLEANAGSADKWLAVLGKDWSVAPYQLLNSSSWTGDYLTVTLSEGDATELTYAKVVFTDNSTAVGKVTDFTGSQVTLYLPGVSHSLTPAFLVNSQELEITVDNLSVRSLVGPQSNTFSTAYASYYITLGSTTGSVPVATFGNSSQSFSQTMVIFGNTAANTVDGQAFNEIYAEAGNDTVTLYSNSAASLIDGGAGVDTVVVSDNNQPNLDTFLQGLTFDGSSYFYAGARITNAEQIVWVKNGVQQAAIALLGAGSQFTTVQAGVNAVEALTPASRIVLIPSGTYNESVILNQPVALVGLSASVPSIQAVTFVAGGVSNTPNAGGSGSIASDDSIAGMVTVSGTASNADRLQLALDLLANAGTMNLQASTVSAAYGAGSISKSVAVHGFGSPVLPAGITVQKDFSLVGITVSLDGVTLDATALGSSTPALNVLDVGTGPVVVLSNSRVNAGASNIAIQVAGASIVPGVNALTGNTFYASSSATIELGNFAVQSVMRHRTTNGSSNAALGLVMWEPNQVFITSASTDALARSVGAAFTTGISNSLINSGYTVSIDPAWAAAGSMPGYTISQENLVIDAQGALGSPAKDYAFTLGTGIQAVRVSGQGSFTINGNASGNTFTVLELGGNHTFTSGGGTDEVIFPGQAFNPNTFYTQSIQTPSLQPAYIEQAYTDGSTPVADKLYNIGTIKFNRGGGVYTGVIFVDSSSQPISNISTITGGIAAAGAPDYQIFVRGSLNSSSPNIYADSTASFNDLVFTMEQGVATSSGGNPVTITLAGSIANATLKDGSGAGNYSNSNLTGNALANTLTGNSADNIFTTMGGSDFLYGGAGYDTAILPAGLTIADLTFASSGSAYTVTYPTVGSVTGATVTLDSIESLQISGNPATYAFLSSTQSLATQQAILNNAVSSGTVVIAMGTFTSNLEITGPVSMIKVGTLSFSSLTLSGTGQVNDVAGQPSIDGTVGSVTLSNTTGSAVSGALQDAIDLAVTDGTGAMILSNASTVSYTTGVVTHPLTITLATGKALNTATSMTLGANVTFTGGSALESTAIRLDSGSEIADGIYLAKTAGGSTITLGTNFTTAGNNELWVTKPLAGLTTTGSAQTVSTVFLYNPVITLNNNVQADTVWVYANNGSTGQLSNAMTLAYTSGSTAATTIGLGSDFTTSGNNTLDVTTPLAGLTTNALGNNWSISTVNLREPVGTSAANVIARVSGSAITVDSNAMLWNAGQLARTDGTSTVAINSGYSQTGQKFQVFSGQPIATLTGNGVVIPTVILADVITTIATTSGTSVTVNAGGYLANANSLAYSTASIPQTAVLLGANFTGGWTISNALASIASTVNGTARTVNAIQLNATVGTSTTASGVTADITSVSVAVNGGRVVDAIALTATTGTVNFTSVNPTSGIDGTVSRTGLTLTSTGTVNLPGTITLNHPLQSLGSSLTSTNVTVANSSASSTIFPNAWNLLQGGSGSQLTIQGTSYTYTGTVTLNKVIRYSAAADVTVSDVTLATGGSLVQLGTGRLYANSVTVTSGGDINSAFSLMSTTGTLNVSGTFSSTNPITVPSGYTLNIQGTSTIAAPITVQTGATLRIPANLTSNGGITIQDGGTLSFEGGNLNGTGGLTLGTSGGTGSPIVNATANGSIAQTITMFRPTTITVDSAHTLTLNGALQIASTGGLTKAGAGTLDLAAAGINSRPTLVSEGTLRLSNATALGSGGTLGRITVSSGATLDLNLSSTSVAYPMTLDGGTSTSVTPSITRSGGTGNVNLTGNLTVGTSGSTGNNTVKLSNSVSGANYLVYNSATGANANASIITDGAGEVRYSSSLIAAPGLLSSHGNMLNGFSFNTAGVTVAGPQAPDGSTIATQTTSGVTNITVNQRSMIKVLTLQFQGQVNPIGGWANAIQLLKADGSSPAAMTISIASSLVSGNTQVNITWSGTNVDASTSLADGIYQLKIDTDKLFSASSLLRVDLATDAVKYDQSRIYAQGGTTSTTARISQNLAGNGQAGGGIATYEFQRLFGDSNGDGLVTSTLYATGGNQLAALTYTVNGQTVYSDQAIRNQWSVSPTSVTNGMFWYGLTADQLLDYNMFVALLNDPTPFGP